MSKHRQPELNIREPLNSKDLYGNTKDFCKLVETRPVEILIGRWKQWSLDGLDKKNTRRPPEQICLPVDNWPLTTRARALLLPSVLFERSMCPWRSGRASSEISEAS